MSTATLPSLSSLLSSRRPHHALPAGLYTRPDVFEADMQVFFQNHWILVGLECEIPEPGDAQVLDIGKAGLILLRDDDGQVRAFHNTCRHRGARILDAGATVISKLVCPYHQWTYEPTGELIHAPHMGVDFDKSCRSLKPVAVRNVGGLLYVCLGENPPKDIAVLQDVMEERLAPYGLRDAKVAHQVDVIEKGNWKLTMENNRECYHCVGSHPELCVTFFDLDFGFDPAAMSAEERARAEQHVADRIAREKRWEAEGFKSSHVERVIDCETNFRTQRLAINGGGESQTPDGKAACAKLMGSMTRKDLGDTHLWGHNGWNHFMGDHVVSAMVIPLTADTTLVRTKWLVHKDAREGVDYDLNRLTDVWIATTDQDADLVARSQAGVQDPAYEPGVYSPHTEKQLDNFASWYVQRMQAHGY
ncbi:aromatic ring-hydroxylating oxygenase subunit alpha [Azohydromonas lata]|uniref:Aromatic ring-hydroxylating dioxygenase subunit alpha n=1 Tax=Azohydromonas lata TaxID=45677 RepID=A0ABU5IEU0_9BURK|nr:aromatic ring-hydroxylating dioxygenase subunit alpha [Azohydromonas lata]MDZ5457493.1 aromatic ring-hydroxylating dioxygenase subunit alpha [Azohydromonas lata]